LDLGDLIVWPQPRAEIDWQTQKQEVILLNAPFLIVRDPANLLHNLNLIVKKPSAGIIIKSHLGSDATAVGHLKSFNRSDLA